MNDENAAIRVGKRVPGGRGLSAALVRRGSEIELDRQARGESRLRIADSRGRALELDLPPGVPLRDGDVLVGEDGSLIRVKAAPQPVLAVTPCPEHGSPLDLLRAAYFLGQRHVALDLRADRLLLEPDPALADLLRRRHLIVSEASSPFDPEADADDGHAHEHAHGHAHGHAHAHGAGCGHDH
jgi:urease accessory protein